MIYIYHKSPHIRVYDEEEETWKIPPTIHVYELGLFQYSRFRERLQQEGLEIRDGENYIFGSLGRDIIDKDDTLVGVIGFYLFGKWFLPSYALNVYGNSKRSVDLIRICDEL